MEISAKSYAALKIGRLYCSKKLIDIVIQSDS